MPKLKPISQESEIIEQAKDVQEKQEAGRSQSTPNKDQYHRDTQLPPGGSEYKGKVALDVPEEVGYISRFPISAYVMSSFYGVLMIFLTYLAYSAATGKDASLMSRSVLEPVVSIVVASFLILALLGGSKIVRWSGLLVSVLSLAYTVYMIKSRYDILNIKTDNVKFNEILSTYLQDTFGYYLWVYIFAALLLAVTIIYSASPKYKAAYR